MTTIVKTPKACTAQELEAFEEMVRKGEEVTPAGLSELISHAAILLFLNDVDGRLVGISAIKRPRLRYRSKVFKRAQSTLGAEDYGLELGWVFVAESHRGRKLSHRLVKQVLSHVSSEKVYATSREANLRMKRTLERYGFHIEGGSYLSEDAKYSLNLYVR